MKLIPDEQSPVLDMEIPVILKVRDLMKLNQILTRTYDEEERLRETLSPILQEIRSTLHATATDPEWQSLAKWDAEPEALALAAERQKKHLKRIKRALVKGRNLRIRYCEPGSRDITRSTVIPLELWETATGWLLRAYSYQNGEERTFCIERILKAKQKSCGKTGPRFQSVSPALPEGIEQEMASLAADATDGDVLVQMADDESAAVFAEETDIQEECEAPENTTPDAEQPSAHAVAAGHGGKHPHYSLPGKKPHQAGLPNRLERLIKRAERKTEQ